MEKDISSFLKEFLKSRKRIGSVAPSSKFLTKKIIDNIDFSSAKVIVEYGPGNGVFTKAIAEKISSDTLLYVFELHEPFVKELKVMFADYPNVKIILDSASNINKYLESDGKEKADIIISSLPLMNIERNITIRILKASATALCENGQFIQYQYTLSAKKLLRKVFKLEEIKFAFINLPPAFIYLCKKK